MERVEVYVEPLPTVKSAYKRASSFGFYNPIGAEPYVAVISDTVCEMSDGTHRVTDTNAIILRPADVGVDNVNAIMATLETVYAAALHVEAQT